MPDDQEELGNEEQEGDEKPERFVQMKRDDIRQLEKKAKQADTNETELAELRKERLFFKAKIDVDSPLGKLLYDGYKGDLTVEAISEAAAGIPGLGAEAPSTEIPDDEKNLTDERRDLGAGSKADDFRQAEPDPKEAAIASGSKALDDGKSEEVALGNVFESLMRSAMKGDKRVLWDPNEE